MLWFVTAPQAWATCHFAATRLGDPRRTRRLVHLAQAMANLPGGSLPHLTETWGDVKAAYRLFDRPEVTLAAVCQPHWDLRHQCAPTTYLLLNDTTEIDFGKYRRTTGLGPLNHDGGKGFLLHSALLVEAATGQVCSLAGAVLRTRPPQRKRPKHTRQRAADSEALRWGELIDQVGPPPTGTQWIHVMDREADNFEVFLHCLAQRCAWVVRVRTRQRKVFAVPTGGTEVAVPDLLAQADYSGTYHRAVPARAASAQGPARRARTATLAVRVVAVWMPPPRRTTPYIQAWGGARVRMAVVWAREVAPPPEATALEWLLYTPLPTATWADVQAVLRAYERRWLIAEFHKALKTGTQVKTRQLQTADRLAPLVGLSCVEAVRLVQLKTAAQTTPERLARAVVPLVYETVLEACRKKPTKKPEPVGPLTVRQFFRRLAQLGGFLGRAGDGEPGWQTLWRGWEKLTLLVRGHLATHRSPDTG